MPKEKTMDARESKYQYVIIISRGWDNFDYIETCSREYAEDTLMELKRNNVICELWDNGMFRIIN